MISFVYLESVVSQITPFSFPLFRTGGSLVPHNPLPFSATKGLSRKAKNERKEKDLCRPPTHPFMQPATTFVVETSWFSKLVSFKVEFECPDETVVIAQIGSASCIARD